MNNEWKEYFSFTRKERAGIAVLLVLIGISVLIPRFLMQPAAPDALVQAAFLAKQAELLEMMADTLADADKKFGDRSKKFGDSFERFGNGDEKFGSRFEKFGTGDEKSGTAVPKLFYFDPNLATADEWLRLGVRKHTIATIMRYKSKGGRFRVVEDLKKIYNLPLEDYNKLKLYIRIAKEEQSKAFYTNAETFYTRSETFHTRSKAFETKPKAFVMPAPALVDINEADTTAFIALPGIGNRLANRIVNFRDKLGGFYSVKQVGETYGLPDSTFQLIKARLVCEPGAVRKININTADANELKQHPYIKWALANAIVQYRVQHGPYRSVEDLKQIATISEEQYGRIINYLSID